MIFCPNCNNDSGYIVKDGGTIFCIDCLYIINRKHQCKGVCTVRCLACDSDKLKHLSESLRKERDNTRN